MAMLIARQSINAARREGSKLFTRGFLIVAPGLTIKDRLRVLQPNDPDSYYASRELVPQDMLEHVKRAKIVRTNYHAFMLRERIELSKGGRQLLQGRTGDAPQTLETRAQLRFAKLHQTLRGCSRGVLRFRPPVSVLGKSGCCCRVSGWAQGLMARMARYRLPGIAEHPSSGRRSHCAAQ